jgi:alkylation response protein AidB-like acyl-CoA dehydrogenase
MTLTAADPTDAADLLRRVEDLVPLLARNARQCEAQRRLPAENLDALAGAGVVRMSVPHRFGGLESDLPAQVDVLAALARGCGSTSWVTSVYSVCTWLDIHR